MTNDLISRSALKKKAITLEEGCKEWEVVTIDAIDNAPTVDRPHGEWIVDEEHSITMTFYKCTNCDFFGGATWYKFCPICGADMQKEVENE